MTKILAISGKKQSGKTTSSNFLFGCAMLSEELVEYAHVDEHGGLIIPYETPDGNTRPCFFPVDSFHPNMVEFMRGNVWHNTKIYNFADNLKRLCVDILGLTERQCYGTDEEKNSVTNFTWSEVFANTFDSRRKEDGYMTAREIMQYVGTDFFRKIYPEVWVESTIRKIKQDGPRLAVISDCRFPNEADGVKKAGGKVIRLTRDPFAGEDRHSSETALDNYDGFDAIIDNSEMTIAQQCESLYNLLADWRLIDYTSVAKVGEPPQ